MDSGNCFSAETIHPREDRNSHLIRNIRSQSENGDIYNTIYTVLFLLATCLWHEWRDEVSKLGPVYYQRKSHCWKALLDRRFQFNGRRSQRSLRTTCSAERLNFWVRRLPLQHLGACVIDGSAIFSGSCCNIARPINRQNYFHPCRMSEP